MLRDKLTAAKSFQQGTAVAVHSARVCEVARDLRRDRTHSAAAGKLISMITSEQATTHAELLASECSAAHML